MTKPQLSKTSWGLLLFFLAGVLWLAFVHVTFPLSIKIPNMTRLPPKLEALFSATRNICFGRFIVTLPATADVVYGPAYAPLKIYPVPGDAHRMDYHVTDQLKEIEKEKKYARFPDDFSPGGGKSLYGKVLDGASLGQKFLFGQSQGIFYKIYSFAPVGEDLYIQEGSAPPEPDSADLKIGWAVDPQMSIMNTIVRSMRPRHENEVPNESGMCIEGAFIADNPALTNEYVTLGVRLKEFPDIHFSIAVTRNQGELVDSNSLEVRSQRANKAAWQADPLWAARIRKLRSGSREVNGWKGFEQLEHLPAYSTEADMYHFAFVSLGHPTDPLQPNLDVELKSGVQDNRSGRVRPSLSEEEAVAAWDRLLGSIRVRPTGAKASGMPARTPLGTRLGTGYKCPQTGLWECADDLALAQPRAIWLEQGESMPRAQVWNPPTAWQRLTGRRTWSCTGAAWRLAAYERPAPPLEASAGCGAVSQPPTSG